MELKDFIGLQTKQVLAKDLEFTEGLTIALYASSKNLYVNNDEIVAAPSLMPYEVVSNKNFKVAKIIVIEVVPIDQKDAEPTVITLKYTDEVTEILSATLTEEARPQDAEYESDNGPEPTDREKTRVN